jgi:hypothetical protein
MQRVKNLLPMFLGYNKVKPKGDVLVKLEKAILSLWLANTGKGGQPNIPLTAHLTGGSLNS